MILEIIIKLWIQIFSFCLIFWVDVIKSFVVMIFVDNSVNTVDFCSFVDIRDCVVSFMVVIEGIDVTGRELTIVWTLVLGGCVRISVVCIAAVVGLIVVVEGAELTIVETVVWGGCVKISVVFTASVVGLIVVVEEAELTIVWTVVLSGVVKISVVLTVSVVGLIVDVSILICFVVMMFFVLSLIVVNGPILVLAV